MEKNTLMLGAELHQKIDKPFAWRAHAKMNTVIEAGFANGAEPRFP